MYASAQTSPSASRSVVGRQEEHFRFSSPILAKWASGPIDGYRRRQAEFVVIHPDDIHAQNVAVFFRDCQPIEVVVSWRQVVFLPILDSVCSFLSRRACAIRGPRSLNGTEGGRYKLGSVERTAI